MASSKEMEKYRTNTDGARLQFELLCLERRKRACERAVFICHNGISGFGLGVGKGNGNRRTGISLELGRYHEA